MYWIIKHKPTGKYICSKRMMSVSKQLARKFNSSKRARSYLTDCGLPLNELSVSQYEMSVVNESEEEREREITQKIYRNILLRKRKVQ